MIFVPREYRGSQYANVAIGDKRQTSHGSSHAKPPMGISFHVKPGVQAVQEQAGTNARRSSRKLSRTGTVCLPGNQRIVSWRAVNAKELLPLQEIEELEHCSLRGHYHV